MPAADLFALLGEARRPWLDPDRLKDTFHRLSRTEHPDQQAAPSDSFAQLNLAHATLRDPKLRLRHLLELEHPGIKLSGPAAIPPSLAAFFAPVLALIQEADALLARKAAAPSALAKALLARPELALRETIEARLAELDALHAADVAELQAFDAIWPARSPDAAARLHDFYQRFAYLNRWTDQLRERLFQLGL